MYTTAPVNRAVRPSDNKQKKKERKHPGEPLRKNQKKNEKQDKYLARELKNLWNMKMTVITIVISALSIGLVWELELIGKRTEII